MLDLQPITLTRILDGLGQNGLIERRADLGDRRAKRLHLTTAARPLLKRLRKAGDELLLQAFDGVDEEQVERLLAQLQAIKENLRRTAPCKEIEEEARYG